MLLLDIHNADGENWGSHDDSAIESGELAYTVCTLCSNMLAILDNRFWVHVD